MGKRTKNLACRIEVPSNGCLQLYASGEEAARARPNLPEWCYRCGNAMFVDISRRDWCEKCWRALFIALFFLDTCSA